MGDVPPRNGHPLPLDGPRNVKEIVKKRYHDFMPVKHPTTDLDSYDVLSVLKIERERNKQEADLTHFSSKDHKEASVYEYLFPAKVFNSKDLPAERNEWLLDKPMKKIEESVRVELSLNQGISVDLGDVYERKVSEISEWVDQHESIEGLGELFETCELYMVSHVLYSEKMVILGGNDKLTSSASDPRPIAFKVEKLHVRQGKIVLAPQGGKSSHPRYSLPSFETVKWVGTAAALLLATYRNLGPFLRSLMKPNK